jgi:hypothetical protein
MRCFPVGIIGARPLFAKDSPQIYYSMLIYQDETRGVKITNAATTYDTGQERLFLTVTPAYRYIICYLLEIRVDSTVA